MYKMEQSLSYLKKELRTYVFLFIEQFDRNESKMRQIVREFQRISDEVKEMQENTNKARKVGAVTGGIGAGFILGGLLLAPLTGGASLVAVGVGSATAVGGGATVVGSNIKKILSESRCGEKVEMWGKEFMAKVEPMKENLKDIQVTCENLEKESAEAQAENTLADVKELQKTLARVSRLKNMAEGLWFEADILLFVLGELVKIIKQIFSLTDTPEEDQRLRDAIIKSADQSQKIIEGFDEMKTELRKCMNEI